MNGFQHDHDAGSDKEQAPGLARIPYIDDEASPANIDRPTGIKVSRMDIRLANS
jgi:hypothetical protein